jgi:hypothetical protein
MRLIEKCPCGGEVEMNYAVDTIGSSRTEREAERNEGRKQIDVFRRAHKPCLKRLGESPPPADTAAEFDMDAHDDMTEDRLLERMEAQNLLGAGETAASVRAALDA